MSARPRLILASASPRRLDLLRQLGVVPDEVCAADVDETPHRRELPRDVAKRLACAKATRVAEALTTNEPAIVIGADTVVACGRRILPRAETEAEARRCLSLLSGRRHRVFGGICVVDIAGKARLRVVETRITFKRLSDTEIAAYIASGEWRGKAGGYAIQGRAAGFVEWINGSYSNVVGLALFETRALLQGAGFPVE